MSDSVCFLCETKAFLAADNLRWIRENIDEFNNKDSLK